MQEMRAQGGRGGRLRRGGGRVSDGVVVHDSMQLLIYQFHAWNR